MKGFLCRNVLTSLRRTHYTNDVVGVFQSLFIGDKLSFAKKYLAFGFLFFWGKKGEAGRAESLRKVDGLVVDILTLVADKFVLVVYKKGT